MVRLSFRFNYTKFLVDILGIIHCQILEGKYADAKQQIEFQHEVQTGNTAVSSTIIYEMGEDICF